MSAGSTFWSRRRAAVEAEKAQEQAALEAAALAEEHAALDAQTDDEILAQLDLPDPDTLKDGDDFTAFMAKAVPDRIRRRALRTLWRSNPVLANVDGLVDYGQDFTDSATVVEDLQTAYQVGKGMLKHVEEMARQAVEDAPAEDVDEVIAEDEAEQVAAADLDALDEGGIATLVEVTDEAADDYDDIKAPAPRRMAFRVEHPA